jgi:hypothetical protein
MVEEELQKAAVLLRKFKNELINGNRFFADHTLLSTFENICNTYKKVIKQGTKLYRGRINQFMNKEPFPDDEMGKPGNSIITINRANPPGINYLYLSDDIDTVIAELRPNKNTYITIAEFEITKDTWVVELSDRIPSPGIDDTVFSFAILLGYEYSRSVNTDKSLIEYVPTQYFSEYCKSRNCGFDGIKYLSGVTNTYGGFNYALFRDSNVIIKRKEVRLITSIKYSHEIINYT